MIGENGRALQQHQPLPPDQVHELFHAGSCPSPELDVHGLDRPCLCDQVGCLVLSTTRRAPRPNVPVGRRLCAVLQFADAREMPTGRGGKLATGQAGIFAQVPKAKPEGFLYLSS